MREENRFSYQHCQVLEQHGEVVALLMSYSAIVLGKLAILTGKQMREVLGAGGMMRMLRRSLPFMRHKECEADEYYVFTIAVSPDFQGKGAGKRLLEMARLQTLRAGLSRCSLGVTLNNIRGVAFYSRNGFEIVDTVKTPSLLKAIEYPGYYKMRACYEQENHAQSH